MTAKLEGTDKNGEVGVSFTSRRMAWAYQKKDVLSFGIEKNGDELITTTKKTDI